MPPKLAAAFAQEIAKFKELILLGQVDMAWVHLERAHILGQFFVWPHLLTHFYMMKFAVQNRNTTEILGQIPRLLLAAPGSLFRAAPKGNTGGANVGIFKPMPIPDDLREILELH